MRIKTLYIRFRTLCFKTLAAYLAMALFFWPVLAQDAVPAEKQNPVLKYENAPLDMVLQEYGKLTGRTLLISPLVAKNTLITLKNQTELTLQETLDAIETVLSMHSIALIREGDKFLRVVKSDMARMEPMPIVEKLPEEEADPIKDSGELISKMIELKHIDLKEAAAAIQPLMHTYGKVVHYERVNAMLVTDTAANINRIQQIFGYIDQPAEAREKPWVKQIQFAKASDIKKRLEEIIAESQKAEQQKQTVSMPKMAGSPGIKRSTVSRTLPGIIRPKPTAKSGVSDSDIASLAEQAERGVIRGKVQIVADERTNILIIITREENMAFFDKIIKVLDVPTEPDVVVKVIRLEYAEADSVATTINSLIGKKKKDVDQTSTATGGANKSKGAEATALKDYVDNLRNQAATVEKGSAGVGELSAENMTILADKRTNALIIMARKADMITLEEIIKGMDIMLSQVLIEVAILQVDLSDEFQSGIHLIQRSLIINDVKKNGAIEPVGAIAGSAGAGTESLLSATSLTDVGGWAGSQGLATYFTYFGLNLDAIVSLSKVDRRVKILSTPVITTTDNTEATLASDVASYFLKGTTVDQWGNAHPDVETKKVGLTLKVKPKINKSRNVTMEITQELSGNAGTQKIEDQEWPITQTRSFTASVSVHNKETIILGGLVTTSDEGVRGGVPILMDIPVLGMLFRSKGRDTGKSEVVVFITPYVLDTPEEIAVESRRRRDATDSEDVWKRGWSNSDLAEPIRDYVSRERESPVSTVIGDRVIVPAPKPAVDGAKDLKTDNDGAAKKTVPPPSQPDKAVEDGKNGEDPLKTLDPDLADFIRRSEEKWGNSLKKVDDRIGEEVEKVKNP